MATNVRSPADLCYHTRQDGRTVSMEAVIDVLNSRVNVTRPFTLILVGSAKRRGRGRVHSIPLGLRQHVPLEKPTVVRLSLAPRIARAGLYEGKPRLEHKNSRGNRDCGEGSRRAISYPDGL